MYKKKSLFVTFEGIEGSGKSYQSRRLFSKIKAMGLSAIYTREPGGTVLGEKLREILLYNQMQAETESLLMFAARNEHVQEIIQPNLNKGINVISDRFTDATIAYQVYGFGINKKVIDVIHKEIFGKLKPDFTFFLIIDINKSFERIKKRNQVLCFRIIYFFQLTLTNVTRRFLAFPPSVAFDAAGRLSPYPLIRVREILTPNLPVNARCTDFALLVDSFRL